MSNQLIAIGGLGQYRVYLNVPLEEAKRRYEKTYENVDWDREDVRVIDFDDEFDAYDVWWFPREKEQPIRTYWVQDPNIPEIEVKWAEYPGGRHRPTSECRQKR